MPIALKSVDVFEGTKSFMEGIGIHTGGSFVLRLHPLVAHSDHRIEFFTRQEGVEYSCPALWTRLSGTTRSTALVMRGPSRRRLELRTIEHFLAAATILGLRARVEISPTDAAQNPDVLEIPVLDGAAQDWLHWIRGQENFALLRSSPTQGRLFVCRHEFELRDGDRSVKISPLRADGLKTEFSYSVNFAPSWQQSAHFEIDWSKLDVSAREFETSIAPARTFGFQHELKDLERRSLALGGSLANALLLDGDRVVNPEGFRFSNELAAHKLLDAIGDFSLVGAPLLARIECRQAGHSMHLRAVEEAMRTGAIQEWND